MKKILQISNYQYPHIGGIEQVARDIADSLLDDKEIEQKMICFNEDAQDGNYLCHRKETMHDSVDGVEVIRCGCFAKVASQSLSFTYPSELKKVLKDFGPDIVILHYPNPFVSSFLLPMLPKITKFVLYWHLDITKQKILGKLFHGQTLHLLERADKVIATSPNYVDGSPYLSQFRAKCEVIPNCIRMERLTPTAAIYKKAELIRKENEGKILCFGVGRHVPYKGFTYLVKASKLLDDSFRIYIGGKGELTQSLKEEAKDDPKIQFLGRVSDEDMIAYYLACDIFCFPSITKNEAFGIALAEGMYFANPAVTFTIPGSGVNYVNLADVTGIECPNGDVRAYANALKTLADNPELREKYGIAAKQRVIDKFTYREFKSRINDMICRVRKQN